MQGKISNELILYLTIKKIVAGSFQFEKEFICFFGVKFVSYMGGNAFCRPSSDVEEDTFGEVKPFRNFCKAWRKGFFG